MAILSINDINSLIDAMRNRYAAQKAEDLEKKQEREAVEKKMRESWQKEWRPDFVKTLLGVAKGVAGGFSMNPAAIGSGVGDVISGLTTEGARNQAGEVRDLPSPDYGAVTGAIGGEVGRAGIGGMIYGYNPKTGKMEWYKPEPEGLF